MYRCYNKIFYLLSVLSRFEMVCILVSINVRLMVHSLGGSTSKIGRTLSQTSLHVFRPHVTFIPLLSFFHGDHLSTNYAPAFSFPSQPNPHANQLFLRLLEFFNATVVARVCKYLITSRHHPKPWHFYNCCVSFSAPSPLVRLLCVMLTGIVTSSIGGSKLLADCLAL
jgi:hypothetical protein